MLNTTLTQWQIFNAVIDHGGYLQAAEKLSRSHSSLHHAVQKLQDQLGVKLLTIKGKQVKLTAVGEVMQRRSRRLIKDAEELEQLARTTGEGWETEITAAVEGIYPSPLLSGVLARFHDQGKGTRLKVDSVILNGAVEAITKATADLVISPIVPQGYLGSPLMAVKMAPYAHKNHPLVTAKTSVETGELHRHLQIVISDRTTQQLPTAMGWLKSEQRWTVSSFHQARDILLAGHGFCWLPAHMIENDVSCNDLHPLKTRDKLESLVPLSLVIPAPEKLGPAGRLLADLFRKAAALPDA